MTKKVMVAGHICLDITPQFLQGKQNSITDVFSPGKLINVGKAVFSTGGAVSNTGLAMAKLGVDVYLNGKVGDDEFGGIIKHLVGKERAKAFSTVSDQSTSYSIVLAVPGIDRIFLHDPGTNDTLGVKDIDYDLAKQCSVFHFGYPTLMKRMYEKDGSELIDIYKRIKQLNVTTCLDMTVPDPASPSGKVDWAGIIKRLSPYLDIFVPSLEEIAYMIDRPLFEKRKSEAAGNDAVMVYKPEDCRNISEKLISMGVKIVAIKCGTRGLYLRTAKSEAVSKIGNACPQDVKVWSQRELWAPSYKTDNFVSALGAGDTTIAGFLCGLIHDFTPADSLRTANIVGLQNVQALDALSGIKDWQTTLKMLQEKNRPINNTGLENTDWQFSKDLGIYISPNDKK